MTALLWLAVPGGAQTTPQDWPMFGGGPTHAWVAAEPGPAPPLAATWTVGLGGSGNRELSGAAVASGLAVANGERHVIAFDAATGEQRWTLGHARGPIVMPAVDSAAGLVVYVEGTGAKSAVVAADLQTRTQRWRVSLRAPVESPPSLDGGRVYFGARDGFVYAVALDSGSVQWKQRLDGVVDGSPAVAGGRVFAVAVNTSGSGRLYALDAETGKQAWSEARPGSVGASAPSVDAGRVFVGFNDGTVRALDVRDGTLLWSKAVRSPFARGSSPAVSGGSVFAADADGAVYRFDERTGERKWEFQFPSANTVYGSALVSSRWVMFGAADGTVGAIDVGSGHLVWETRFAPGGAGTLTPSGDLLLVPITGRQGKILALRHESSGRLVDRESPTTLHLPIALANFAVAAIAVLVVLLGLFRLLSRSADRRGAAAAEGPDDAQPAPDEDEPA